MLRLGCCRERVRVPQEGTDAADQGAIPLTDITVARSILDQLGGARFVAMTGAREFVGSADSLTFKIGVNPKHVTKCA